MERERRAAEEADAEAQRRDAQAEVQDGLEASSVTPTRTDSEPSWSGGATEKLAEAKRLADEAAGAARAAAEEAATHRRWLAKRSNKPAALSARQGDRAATPPVTGNHRHRSQARARLRQRRTWAPTANPELIELAAGRRIEKRTTMTKRELVDAIAKASRATR